MATLAAVAASVSLGEFAVPLGDVLASLAGAGEKASNYIVLELRLPRALTGLLAGAAFGLAGAAFQELARNPLVAPDVVGVSGGAALAAVSVIVFGGSSAAGIGADRRAGGSAGRGRRALRARRGDAACMGTGWC